LEFPRAKKEVWVRRRVVVVIDVGSRVRCAGFVISNELRNRREVGRGTYRGRRVGCGREGIRVCSGLLSG
jgi:hypothetical protein